MKKYFSTGDVIYGYCNGVFGRDDYDQKVCVKVTKKYAIFQYLDGEWKGNAVALNRPKRLSKKMVKEWKNSEGDV